jgi:ribonuclease HI
MTTHHPASVSIHIDGASRGNPGDAACAYVIAMPSGPPIEEAIRLERTTNNVAEYTALLHALRRARLLGVSRLLIHSDSELLVKQMNGEYRVKSADLLPLYEEAKDLCDDFDVVTLRHVRREQNKRADELCNLALDGKLGGDSKASQHAKPGKHHAPTKQAAAKSGARADQARAEAVVCLQAAADAWARGGVSAVRPEAVWDQLWSILHENEIVK